MPSDIAAPPLQTPLIEGPNQPYITKVWYGWLRSIITRVQDSAQAVASVPLTGQSAGVGLTPLIVAAAAGLYRVSYWFRVTTPATVSSSLQVAVTTTEGGVVVTQTGPAYTGNLTTEPQSGNFVVNPDGGTPVSYEVLYGSVGATAMEYDASIVLDQL